MPYDLTAFKVLLRKLFPPKECVFTVDTTGDGKIDSLQIKFLNLLIPFVIPSEIEIGDFNSKDFDPTNFDLSKYGNFILNDTPLNLSKNNLKINEIRNRILIYHRGKSFSFDEILEGKLRGRTINIGDSVTILLKLDEETLKMFTEGKHSFKIESDLISNLEIIFELDESNMNILFDPNNT